MCIYILRLDQYYNAAEEFVFANASQLAMCAVSICLSIKGEYDVGVFRERPCMCQR